MELTGQAKAADSMTAVAWPKPVGPLEVLGQVRLVVSAAPIDRMESPWRWKPALWPQTTERLELTRCAGPAR